MKEKKMFRATGLWCVVELLQCCLDCLYIFANLLYTTVQIYSKNIAKKKKRLSAICQPFIKMGS